MVVKQGPGFLAMSICMPICAAFREKIKRVFLSIYSLVNNGRRGDL